MTERKDFDLQGGSAAQGSGEKCTEGRQNRGWREPAQVSHFQLHPSLRDAQFNVEQIDGLPEHYYVRPEPKLSPLQRHQQAEAFFAATNAEIPLCGSRAHARSSRGPRFLPRQLAKDSQRGHPRDFPCRQPCAVCGRLSGQNLQHFQPSRSPRQAGNLPGSRLSKDFCTT
jgi:hypothetical protein